MTERDVPERLSESVDASDPLTRALRASVGEGPHPEQLASIGGGLEQAMLQGAPSMAVPHPSGGALKLLAPLLVLGGIAWLWSREPAPAVVTVTAPAPAAVAPPAGPASPPAPSAAPTAAPAAPLPEPTPRPERAARAPALLPDPAVAVAEQPPDELTLLRAAQAELASAPAQALETLAEHQRHFPQGALAQEREVLAVDALLSLGRLTEARARADALPRAFPDTPHRRRLQRLFERHGAVPVPTQEVP